MCTGHGHCWPVMVTAGRSGSLLAGQAHVRGLKRLAKGVGTVLLHTGKLQCSEMESSEATGALDGGLARGTRAVCPGAGSDPWALVPPRWPRNWRC